MLRTCVFVFENNVVVVVFNHSTKRKAPIFFVKKILILLFASIVYSSGIDFCVGMGLFVCCGKVSL